MNDEALAQRERERERGGGGGRERETDFNESMFYVYLCIVRNSQRAHMNQ